MRLTVSISDNLGDSVKNYAANEKLSVSGLASKALEYYINEQRKKKLSGMLLDIVGKKRVSKDALEQLELDRNDDRF